MPSPKAILCDIAELKLDPTKAHKTCGPSGRLRNDSTLQKVIEVQSSVRLETMESVVAPSDDGKDVHSPAVESLPEASPTVDDLTEKMSPEESVDSQPSVSGVETNEVPVDNASDEVKVVASKAEKVAAKKAKAEADKKAKEKDDSSEA